LGLVAQRGGAALRYQLLRRRRFWSATAKLSLFLPAWTILGDDSQPTDGESGCFAAARQKRYALAQGRWPAGNRRHSASMKGWRQFQTGT
jgi:hypothetical protein